MKYQTIIVGAGIAGLNAAYILKKQGQTDFIILEKGHIGGRAGTQLFHGVPVAIGAGVGRKRKDKILIDLLDDLSVPHTEFKTNARFVEGLECNVKQLFMQIREAYEKAHKPVRKTFREFAEPLLGTSRYREFIQCAGYTDYENEDIESTLYDYGFDDNYLNWTGISVPWKTLIDKLVAYIGKSRILCGKEVVKISRTPLSPSGWNHFIHTKDRKIYNCNKIIVATTASTTRLLFPELPIYKQIMGQPFLRIYGKFDTHSARILAERTGGHTTIVRGDLQKIIPMNTEKGVFMIAYSDNRKAVSLSRHKENTAENRDILSRKLESALGIPRNTLNMQDMVSFYWDEGTHYYTPLLPEYRTRSDFIRQAQNPYPNIRVIGEMVSRNQGWVKGALE